MSWFPAFPQYAKGMALTVILREIGNEYSFNATPTTQPIFQPTLESEKSQIIQNFHTLDIAR